MKVLLVVLLFEVVVVVRAVTTYISPHETPRDVPTKPLYPGPGQWAKYGVSHTPYIQPQPIHTQQPNDDNERPDGYEIFEQGKEQFNKAQQKYYDEHGSLEEIQPPTENYQTKPKVGFIPQKRYAQVRKTESEKHLPRSEIDSEEEDRGRLREVIRDSKIHTVYTEEGYEDSAYDHAGHEKKAENSESNSQLDEHVEQSKKQKKPSNNKTSRRKKPRSKTSQKQHHDIDYASSEHRPITPTKSTKKIKLKNGKNIDLEIQTEVKLLPNSNNKKHKYVKIFPKQENQKHKRVKRYDKELLSKRYIRKRPNYYWKKNKSSNKNQLNGRKTREPETIKKAIDTVIPLPTINTATATTAEPNKDESTTKNPTRMPFRPKTRPVVAKKIPVKRQKRYTIDHPEIEVDLDKFVKLEKIQTTTPKPDLTHIKYPYYKLPVSKLNVNSPLRYAQDLNNVPVKIHGEMSFYESRSHIICPEVDTDINPIPEKFENQQEEYDDYDSDEKDEPKQEEKEVKMPRLQDLGDKIDCFKVKYFGENPLDSPFFQEDSIKLSAPVFFNKLIKPSKQINQSAKQNQLQSQPNKQTTKKNYKLVVNKKAKLKNKSVNKLSPNVEKEKTISVRNKKNAVLANSKKKELKIEILEPIVVIDDELFEVIPSNTINEKFEASTESKGVETKINQVDKKMLLRSAPKSIYDQLVSLDNKNETVKSQNVKEEPEKFLIIYENKRNKEVNGITKSRPTTTTTTTEKPQLRENSETRAAVYDKHKKNEVAIPKTNVNSPYNSVRSFSRQPAMPFTYIFDISKYLPRVTTHAIVARYKRDTKTKCNMDCANFVKRSTDNINGETNHNLVKRQVNENLQEQYSDENNNDLMMDGTKIFEQYVPYMESRSKYKRHTKIDQDDLMAEESESYATFARKPKVYTNIVRSRPVNRERTEEAEDEEEDLNPRKRVYELKTLNRVNSEQRFETVKVPHEEVVEDEEETSSIATTTTEPIIYPVEANPDNGKIAQYIFIIERLHEKRLLENPSTEAVVPPGTDQPDTNTLATETTSESVRIPEGEPAFLQIISHLHQVRQEVNQSDGNAPDVETSSTNEEVKQQTTARNFNPFNLESLTPDSFMAELSYMQAKLDPDGKKSEESARSRNYNDKLKTTVDTSKYKSIDRGSVNMRHNFSSRYNSADQDLPLNKSQTTQKPIVSEITPAGIDSETKSTQTVSSLSQTTQSVTPKQQSAGSRLRQRSRTRTRPITVASTTTTTTTQPLETVTTNPAFRRRRLGRITTTTEAPTTTATQRTIPYRGRHLSRRPTTHTTTTESQVPSRIISTVRTNSETTPSTESTDATRNGPGDNKKRRTLQKVHERRVMSSVTLTRYYEPASDEVISTDSIEDTKNAQESKKHQYEVIGPLTHTDTRHGGNYKYAENVTTKATPKAQTASKVSDPENFYKDPNLAVNINQLKEEPKVAKNQSSSTVYSKKDISKAVVQEYSHTDDTTFPSMAHMVNGLLQVEEEEQEETSTVPVEEESVNASPTRHRPNIIKDPSRRMYFYASID